MDLAAATPYRIAARGPRAVSTAWLLAMGDLVVLFACFGSARVANWLFSGVSWQATWFHIHIQYSGTPFVIYLILGIACVVAFRHLGHYARRRPFWQELGDILAVVATMAVIDAALVFLTKTNFSRVWWGASWTLVLVMVPLVRVLAKRMLMARGAWLRPTVVIGAGPNAVDAAKALASEPMLGFDVVAFICPPLTGERAPGYLEIDGRRRPVLRAAPSAELLPLQFGCPHIVVALEMEEMAQCGAYVERLSFHYDDIDIVSPMRGLPLAGTRVTHFFGHDILSLRVRNTLARPWPPRLKRAFDILVAGLLLALLSPLLAIIAWQVSRTGWPIVYRHERIGRGGRRFNCLKFRTMARNADAVLARHLSEHPEARAEWERNQKLRDDPRVSPMVAWIRRTSLDELPQLINVVRGEMSLVGPRPVVQSELPRYDANLVYYVAEHARGHRALAGERAQ